MTNETHGSEAVDDTHPDCDDEGVEEGEGQERKNWSETHTSCDDCERSKTKLVLKRGQFNHMLLLKLTIIKI